MTFLFEAWTMSEPAQIITALAILMIPLKGLIWVIRCPRDSPNYKLPPLKLLGWREGSDD